MELSKPFFIFVLSFNQNQIKMKFDFKNFQITQVGKPTEVVTQEATPEIPSIPDYDLPTNNPFGAVSKGSKAIPAQTKQAHYKYNVRVIDTNTKKLYHFEYSSSIHDWQQGIKKLDEQNLCFAFYCTMSDALAGLQHSDVWDFMDAFGYEDGRKAQKIYDACKQVADDLNEKFDLDEDKLCDLMNELQEEHEDKL